MRIYGKIDDRLNRVVSFDRASAGERYLLVVHPNNTAEWVAQELGRRLQDDHCRGVLVVKGVPRAGLTDEEFTRLKKQYGERFHVSACAVGTAEESTNLSGDLESRFRDFFLHARDADDRLDWSILDPRWPAGLIAVYLLAKVMSDGTEEAALVESGSAAWRPVWESARREHELLTDAPLTPSRLDSGTAREVAERIAGYLRSVAARAS